MAKRIDANQPEIVEALRAIGAWVFDTHCLGHGFPDLLVHYHDKFFLFEVKNGNGRLTAAEQEFRRECPESFVVRDPEEAIKVLQYHTGDR